MRFNSSIPYQRSHRLAVRTLAFQAGNESSILSGSTTKERERMLVYDRKHVYEADAVLYSALITMCVAVGAFAYLCYGV